MKNKEAARPYAKQYPSGPTTFKIYPISLWKGSETEDNNSFICRIGTDYGQGYYYSRPVSCEEFEERFASKENYLNINKNLGKG